MPVPRQRRLSPRDGKLIKYYQPSRGEPLPHRLLKRGSPQWFILHETGFPPPEKRDTYGNHKAIYSIRRKLNLLNLGNRVTREIIKSTWKLKRSDLDPDLMYQGTSHNTKVAMAIREAFPEFDGTFIDGDDERWTDDTDEWFGAQEVVLWGNFPELVRIYSLSEGS